MHILALSSFDSGLNVSRLLGQRFVGAGCTVEFALARARLKQPQIQPHQIEATVGREVPTWFNFVGGGQSARLKSYDIILSCLEGASTRRLIRELALLGAVRPLLVCVYPGLLLRYLYDGLSMRSPADLLWLNSHVDLAAYRAMCLGFGLDDANARVLGVPVLLGEQKRQQDAESGPVVFFEQAVIPATHGERLYLAEQLIALSRRYPTKTFLIKPRARPTDATLHVTRYPIDALMAEAAQASGGWPGNLAMTSERPGVLLARASACLTICSTVAVEAIQAGVPTIIIADFGAHDDYGMHYFLGSGLMRSFAQIRLPATETPDPKWVAAAMPNPAETVDAMIAEAMTFAGRAKKPIPADAAVAEMSPQLRQRLEEIHGVAGVINRKFKTYEPWRLSVSKTIEKGLGLLARRK